MSRKKEEFYDFIEKAKELLLEGKEEVLKSSKIGKILLEVSYQNREKNLLFKKVGKKLYEMDREKLELPKNFDKDFEKLAELDKKIKSEEKKIADLKKKH